MKQHHYLLPIKPLSWSRAGYNVATQTFYDAQKHIKNCYVIYLIQQHGNKKPFEGPLCVDREYYFPIPESLKKRSRSPEMWMYTIPDMDNLDGLLYDSMKMAGVIKDDRYICKGSEIKKYDTTPRIVVTITELL